MNEQGERELVLGNKQLLAIFFVAALLCGVFFALGYVVGGNSAKAGVAAAAADGSSNPAEGKREEPPAQTPSDTSTQAPPSAFDTGAQTPVPESKIPENPAAAGSQPIAMPAAAPSPAVTPAGSKIAAAQYAAQSSGIVVSVPEKGTTYWQVAAPTRPAADDLVKGLREKGLPAILAASSKPDLFEVLVGPYSSSLSLADAKHKLIDLGFNGIVPRKQ